MANSISTTTQTVEESSDFQAYRNQITGFLKTCTIKYQPMVDRYNELVVNNGGTVDESDPTTWKYYLNAQGLYHPIDTVMQVRSLDNQQIIDFTVENLAIHTRTAAAYVPGTSYFNSLCSAYPGQMDLIKSILYPISDVEAAIDADNLTLLQWGSGFLEFDEQMYIVNELIDTLEYLRSRWYFDFLSYEPYFYWVFWIRLWQILAEAIFTARFKAIKTVNVHSWHIWQDLTSRGLDDYSDILDRQQSLFLYRNMDYIVDHRGSQSNLILLVNNILKSIGVGLYGRDVVQNSVEGASDFQLVPEFSAVQIPTDYAVSVADVAPTNMEEMNDRLVEVGDETDSSAEHVSEMALKIGTTTKNTFPTKVVEMRPIDKDKEYAEFLNLFIFDMLVYLIANGKYNSTLFFEDPNSGITYSLNYKDVIILIYYCQWKSLGFEPTGLPNNHTCFSALSLTPEPTPTTFWFGGEKMLVQSFLDPTQYLANLVYPLYTFTNPEDFSNFISSVFETYVYQINQSRITSLAAAQFCMRTVSATKIVRKTYALSLSDATTYAEWFAKHSDIYNRIVSVYDASVDGEDKYSALIDTLMSGLVPLTDILKTYGNFTLTDAGYTKLKNLFIQLCSYNITFLDTVDEVSKTLYIVDTVVDTGGTYTDADGNTSTSNVDFSVIVPDTMGADVTADVSDVIEVDVGIHTIESQHIVDDNRTIEDVDVVTQNPQVEFTKIIRVGADAVNRTDTVSQNQMLNMTSVLKASVSVS